MVRWRGKAVAQSGGRGGSGSWRWRHPKAAVVEYVVLALQQFVLIAHPVSKMFSGSPAMKVEIEKPHFQHLVSSKFEIGVAFPVRSSLTPEIKCLSRIRLADAWMFCPLVYKNINYTRHPVPPPCLFFLLTSALPLIRSAPSSFYNLITKN